MENKLFRIILPLIMIILLVGLIGMIFSQKEKLFSSKEESQTLVTLITVLLTVLLFMFVLLNFRTIQKNPTTITISLLGFPRAGKTVYLTVLFDQLQREKNRSIDFNPYGSETIERVFSDLNILAKQEWLRKTKQNEVFFYRAFATLKDSSPFKLFERKYKIEIGDFAGESFDELNPTTEKWLHKSEFFQYVIQSDAILFAIDVSDIISPENIEVESLQNSFIAALQILIEKKGVSENKRLKAPVAILFLKSDKLKSKDLEDVVLQRMSRLLEVCNKRCLYFDHFFVSSIGVPNEIDLPPNHLEPYNVTTPIIWTLRRLRSTRIS